MKKIVLIIISALIAIALSFFLTKDSGTTNKTNDKIIENGALEKESQSSSSSTLSTQKEEPKKSEVIKLNDGRADVKNRANSSSSDIAKEPSKSEKQGFINLNDGRVDIKINNNVTLKLDSQKEYKEKKSYEYREYTPQEQGREKSDELDISGGVDVNRQQRSIDGVNFKMEKSF